jgi:predicted nucleic-acid-binding protein
MSDDIRVVADTNLLVRYLTEDDPAKASAVDALLKKAGQGKIKILLPSVVAAELVWVLESFYKMSREQISELVYAILNTPGIDVQDEAIISAATKLYGLTRIDFVDAWIIEFAKAKGVTKIHTFDTKHFKNTGIDVSPP